jgi:uncharacterized membrane protein
MTTTNDLQPGESDPYGLRLVMPGKQVPVVRAVGWIGEGWRLFARAPLMWLLAMLILFLFSIIISIVPFIGSAVVQVLNPVYNAGLSVACRSLERGGEFEMEHLLAGFRTRFRPLAIVGLLFLAGMVVILLVFAAAAGFSVIGAFLSGAATPEDLPSVVASSAMSILLGLLVALLLWVPLLAAYWFAPTLVMLNDVPPAKAMKASFSACFRNFIPYLVYGLVMLAIGIVAALPTILVPFVGWLVSVVAFVVIYIVNVTAAYAAYRDIFTE